MAEELRKEFVQFAAHLEKVTGKTSLPECPICSCETWSLEGPHSMISVDPILETQGKRKTIPVIFLVCQTCHFMYQFAWIPIEKDSKADGGKNG